MVKITIVLDDDLYRRLVEESIKKYGSTRKLSRLINEKLRQTQLPTKRSERTTMTLGRKLTDGELNTLIEGAWGEAVNWSV